MAESFRLLNAAEQKPTLPPEIRSGAWYFYDRFADETAFDRHSAARLLSRPAENYSLLMYDSDTSRLYYYEMDT